MAIHQIPVTKAGKRLIEVDSGEAGMTAETYNIIFECGLKHFVNLGMTGLHRADYKTLAEYEDAAFAIAAKQVEKIKAGKISGVSKAKKAAGAKASAEMTEAMRLAKGYAKDQLKAAGVKVSKVKAADITLAAKAYIDADPETWLSAARASLAAASAPVTAPAVDLSSLVAKSEKAKPRAKKAATASKAKPAVAAKAKPAAKPAAKHA